MSQESEALQETLHLALRDPRFSKLLKETVEQADKGEVVAVDDDFFD